MTAHASKLLLQLHPLIAEAKRRMRRRRLFVVLAGAMVAGLAVGLTLALRAPGGHGGALSGSQEARGVEASIEHAVRTNRASAGDTKETFVEVRVSRADHRYAVARTDEVFRGGREDNTGWLLRRTDSGWQVIFVGSDDPPCSVAPARVRKDLLGSGVCFTP
jgi:hypothetical protein